MAENEKEKPVGNVEDFRRAMEAKSVECVTLPASGIVVRLCRPPVFAAMGMGREGAALQGKIIDVAADQIKGDDVAAFTKWICSVLEKIFVEPRFAKEPQPDSLGLDDILHDDVKFIFRWLRGEVVSGVDALPEDLETFRGGPGTASLSGDGGAAQQLPGK